MTNREPDPLSPEHAELADRLRALSQSPVDSAVASAHLTAMAAVRTGRRLRPAHGRFGRSKVAAAFAAGLVLGGTSLASAGVLGNTPQNAVADVAGHVGLDLPGGTPRSTEGCGGKTYKNHGQFVAQGGDPHSACGKPLHSTGKSGKAGKAGKAGNADEPKGTDAGSVEKCAKPPWAGKGNHAKKTPDAVAARNAACGDDSADDDSVAPTTTPPTTAP